MRNEKIQIPPFMGGVNQIRYYLENDKKILKI